MGPDRPVCAVPGTLPLCRRYCYKARSPRVSSARKAAPSTHGESRVMGGQQYAPGGAITFQDLKDLRYYSQIPDTVQAWDYLVQGIETSHSDLSNVQRQLP